jgi:hypothetical protein
MSISVWQIMALESAKLGGIAVPEEALASARTFVENSYDQQRHAIRYNHDPSWLRSSYAILPGSVSGAMFAMQLLGIDENGDAFQDALSFVKARPPTGAWRKPSSNDFVFKGVGNEYYLYYATLALRLRGGSDWNNWNDALKPYLLRSQHRDGSWKPISHYAEYAKDTENDRVYTTAMCVLMLEVYYRYDTPLLKQLATQFTTAKKEQAKPSESRVFVRSVTKGGIAERIGLLVGDGIESMGQARIASLDDIVAALSERGDRREDLKVRRNGVLRTLEISGSLSGVELEERNP